MWVHFGGNNGQIKKSPLRRVLNGDQDEIKKSYEDVIVVGLIITRVGYTIKNPRVIALVGFSGASKFFEKQDPLLMNHHQ